MLRSLSLILLAFSFLAAGSSQADAGVAGKSYRLFTSTDGYPLNSENTEVLQFASDGVLTLVITRTEGTNTLSGSWSELDLYFISFWEGEVSVDPVSSPVLTMTGVQFLPFLFGNSVNPNMANFPLFGFEFTPES